MIEAAAMALNFYRKFANLIGTKRPENLAVILAVHGRATAFFDTTAVPGWSDLLGHLVISSRRNDLHILDETIRRGAHRLVSMGSLEEHENTSVYRAAFPITRTTTRDAEETTLAVATAVHRHLLIDLMHAYGDAPAAHGNWAYETLPDGSSDVFRQVCIGHGITEGLIGNNVIDIDVPSPG
jgi:hypothetical protein